MNKNLSCLMALALSGGILCAADGGGIKGSVNLNGEAPEVVQTPVPEKDQPDCKCKAVADERLVVDKVTKGIKWAVVRILDVKAPTPATNAAPPEMNQKGLTFTPHVVIVAPGTDLTMLNPDPVNHNVHTTPQDFTNPPQNIMQGAAQPKLTYKKEWVKEAEIIQVECNLHPWMKGLIVVHDPRYVAITGADGKFEIKDVPPGKYKVSIFQEKLGEKVLDVEIKAGAEVDMGEVKFDKK